MIDIRALPLYLDGSDGSLWQSRSTWEELLANTERQEKRFVRVSDLLLWLESNNYPIMDLTELLKLSINHEKKKHETETTIH